MGNSSKTLQDAVDYAQSFPELDAVIPASGYSTKMVQQIATAVMQKMLSSALKPIYNRKTIAAFVTNSWQQDYAVPGLVDPAFLQDAVMVEINNTMTPKPIWQLEVNQNIPATSQDFGRPGQLALMLNRDLQYATWGAANTGGQPGPNPQPTQLITNPAGAGAVTPSNPYTQVKDAFGNLWVITTFGTTGSSNPFSTNLNPVFPSFDKPTITATTVTDGSVVWTAVNPNGFGFRMTPLPTQTGVPYQVFPVYQMRPPQFIGLGANAMSQSLDPIPDDYWMLWVDGFIAMLRERHPDPKQRVKYADAVLNWEKSLKRAAMAQDRTRDNAIMYPSQGVMQTVDGWYPNAAYPYGPPY